MLAAVTEFGGYLGANLTSIPNYGERYRAGESISSAFVESAVNQVVSKRMVEKQQMRWVPRSAHLLLQVRAKVLNDELGPVFQRWYPAFIVPADSVTEDSDGSPIPCFCSLSRLWRPATIPAFLTHKASASAGEVIDMPEKSFMDRSPTGHDIFSGNLYGRLLLTV